MLSFADRGSISGRHHAVLIAVLVLLGLRLDASGGPGMRILVTLAVFGVWGWVWRGSVRDRQIMMLACLVLATLGETVLSLVLGLYDYRGGGIPAFVPPGHVLLFGLGLWIAECAPARLPVLVAAGAGSAGALLALSGADTLSLPLALLFCLLVRYGPAPRLYAVMFLLALALELWGTWLGTWAWRADVPGLPLRSLNPPFAAGTFYCVLDWLCLLCLQALRSPSRSAADPVDARSGPHRQELRATDQP